MPELSRTQVATYALIVFVVVLVGSRALASHASGGGSVPAAVPEAGATAAPDGSAAATTGAVAVTSSGGGPAVVHVAGAVNHPGVYRMSAGARVDDAIDEAGGARGSADLDQVNLAAKVTDGQQILVPKRGVAAAVGAAGAGGGAGAGAAPAAPVSLNSATLDQLDTLDGVGPATAEKIIAYRTQHGGFKNVEELAQVPGIGPKKLAALRDQVRV